MTRTIRYLLSSACPISESSAAAVCTPHQCNLSPPPRSGNVRHREQAAVSQGDHVLEVERERDERRREHERDPQPPGVGGCELHVSSALCRSRPTCARSTQR